MTEHPTDAMIEAALQAQCDLQGCHWTDAATEGAATIMRMKMEKALVAAMNAARTAPIADEGLDALVAKAREVADFLSILAEGPHAPMPDTYSRLANEIRAAIAASSLPLRGLE